jgi:hypothetical protein
LKQLLEETEYMYSDRGRLVDIYFLIAHALARQNLTKELVEVYQKIIKECPQQRGRVVV